MRESRRVSLLPLSSPQIHMAYRLLLSALAASAAVGGPGGGRDASPGIPQMDSAALDACISSGDGERFIGSSRVTCVGALHLFARRAAAAPRAPPRAAPTPCRLLQWLGCWAVSILPSRAPHTHPPPPSVLCASLHDWLILMTEGAAGFCCHCSVPANWGALWRSGVPRAEGALREAQCRQRRLAHCQGEERVVGNLWCEIMRGPCLWGDDRAVWATVCLHTRLPTCTPAAPRSCTHPHRSPRRRASRLRAPKACSTPAHEGAWSAMSSPPRASCRPTCATPSQPGAPAGRPSRMATSCREDHSRERGALAAGPSPHTCCHVE